jgi:hypothetical protein
MAKNIAPGALLSVRCTGLVFYVNCDNEKRTHWMTDLSDILLVLDEPHVCYYHPFSFTVLHGQHGIGHAHFGSDGVDEAFLRIEQDV